jgi:CRISPR-associated endonuclease/helicase Cas3
MTATPAGGGEPFRLDDADRAHPVLRARLTAAKPITLADPCGDKDQDIADAAVPHLADLPAGALALVVLNRVAAARALHRRLHEMATRKKDPLAAEVLLLIGRSRSVERDRLIADPRDRLRAGRDRKVGVAVKPLIVVATQCIEVGADLDADLLVSECCPLDALRQRLGRLDRLGRLAAETGRTARAVVICRKSMAWAGTGEPPEDLLYGPAVARTWHWLTQHRDGLDGGIAALDQRLVGVEPALMSAPTVDAPVIFPAYCDLWAQTGPAPAASPDPAIFLALMQVRRQLDGVMG